MIVILQYICSYGICIVVILASIPVLKVFPISHSISIFSIWIKQFLDGLLKQLLGGLWQPRISSGPKRLLMYLSLLWSHKKWENG